MHGEVKFSNYGTFNLQVLVVKNINFRSDFIIYLSNCSGLFSEVQQAFDKVWYNGLLFVRKSFLWNVEYQIFYVKINYATSNFYEIQIEVLEGFVLGLFL